MNKYLIALVIIIIAGLLLYFSKFKTQSLPEALPENVIITYNTGGTELPEGESLYISEKKSYITYETGEPGDSTEHKVELNLTKEQITQVYNTLKDHDFQKIQSKETPDITYDMGSTRIMLTFTHEGKDYEYDVSSGATEEVRKKDRETFRTLVQYFQQYISTHKQQK